MDRQTAVAPDKRCRSEFPHTETFSAMPEFLSPNLTSAIVSSVSDAILALDRERRVILFNPAAADMTGFEPEEMLGKRCTEILDGQLCGVGCYMDETLQQEKGIRDYECDLSRKDGGQRRVVLQTDLLKDEKGETRGVVIVMRDITELRQLREEVRGRYRFHQLIGKSTGMQKVYQRIQQVAPTNATVLLVGETGAGKEMVARAIHFESSRADQPFIAVNCAALPESLLESELFGHVRGAFTGAVADRTGRVEAANRGTLFLDEIGDLSPLVQLKLLRFLQEKTFERVGDTQTRNADVRILAATHRDLKALRDKGQFREDLYYRLNVVGIHLPPLRERRTDILLLVNHFLQHFRKASEKRITGVTEDALALLMNYRWPGNIRELENAIEHAFVCATGERLTLANLPEEILDSDVANSVKRNRERKSADRKAEREMLVEALKDAGGKKAKAARALGISRATLYRKIKEYGYE